MNGRLRLNYGVATPAVPTFQGFDPDTPIAGYYRMRLRSGGVFVGVRIWFGVPLDPTTGEEMDRSLRWQAHANGAYIDLERVWPKCAADAITEAEHDYLTSLHAWGKEHAPNSPQANPHQRINFLTAPLPF